MARNRVYFRIDDNSDLEEQSRNIAARTLSNSSDGIKTIEVSNMQGKERDEIVAELAKKLFEVVYGRYGEDWPNHMPVLSWDAHPADSKTETPIDPQ